MLNSFWRNAFSRNFSSRNVLVLSSLLTVAQTSSRSPKDFEQQCKAKKFGTMATRSDLKKKMSEWAFAPNQTLISLPMDEEKRNFVRRENPNVVFSETYPTPFQNKAQLVCTSSDAMIDQLDMDPSEMPLDEDFSEWVAGNKVIKGSIPLSHRYGGYQFGYWARQLGDGRAILLGEYINAKGDRIELQLKGAGKTPYSRFGDGRAVLRSSIREFLCSEAMYHLNVPTSRAAAIIVTEDTVMRDIFYNGNAKPEKCAVVLRLAPTWFRIGSLEILAKNSETSELNKLIDFILVHHFDHVKPENEDKEDWILAMFANIVDSTAHLVAKWMSVGFTHGVLNTDNLSLASITIDYGPFGFLDSYDPNFIPNHSDDGGRYDYESQPSICLWNLGRLAVALTPILSNTKHEQLQYILAGFLESYKVEHTKLFCQKIGLTFDPNKLDEEIELVDLLMKAFFASSADFNQSFRDMSETDLDSWESSKKWALGKLNQVKKFKVFMEAYKKRLERENIPETTRMERMQQVNPRYILRNWIAQKAIEQAENGDFEMVKLLYKILSNPYVENKEAEKQGFAGPVPNWSKDLVVSCSS